jgi:hypothetical protein
MPIQFNPSKYIKWNDIQRSPYTFGDQRYSEWAKNDDERLMTLALSRYNDELKNEKKLKEAI